MTPTPTPTPEFLPTLTPYPTGIPGIDTLGFTWTYDMGSLASGVQQGVQVYQTIPIEIRDIVASLIIAVVVIVSIVSIARQLQHMDDEKE